MLALALVAGSLHWGVEQILAVLGLIYIWNHLGLSVKATLIGNIVFACLLILCVFIL